MRIRLEGGRERNGKNQNRKNTVQETLIIPLYIKSSGITLAHHLLAKAADSLMKMLVNRMEF
ncbi:MAG: hypothetical protein ACTTG8_05450 [Catonella sp.]|uniref:hypothetical protein n=1 Tax=Catonella sp. TaxID=2382125 RepID=UPI003FA05D67